MRAEHASIVASDSPERTNSYRGRPTHPVTVATEALVEALAAIKCQYERREHTARVLVTLAQQEHAEAQRLKDRVYGDIHVGYLAAEQVAAAMKGPA